MGGEFNSPPILFCHTPVSALYITIMIEFYDTAIHAAREAGELLRKNFGTVLDVSEMLEHDIKLDMDVS